MNTSLLTACGIAMLAASCANFQKDKEKEEEQANLTQDDLNEAQYLRNLLNGDPRNHGIFEVTPGSTVTTVTFTQLEAPDDEAALRESMRDIRANITRHIGQLANTLRFEFPTKTIEE